MATQEVSVIDVSNIDVVTATYDELIASPAALLTVDSVGLLDEKESLAGVPHVITRATFWSIDEDQIKAANKAGLPTPRGYVSLEATVASEDKLARAVRRSLCPVDKVEDLDVEPNERVIYNDGSTGIRRQVVVMLQLAGLIDVGGEATDTEPERDRRFDVPWTEWANAGTQWVRQGEDKDGNAIMVPSFAFGPGGNPLLIHVRRGLEVSTYENAWTDKGTTWYLK